MEKEDRRYSLELTEGELRSILAAIAVFLENAPSYHIMNLKTAKVKIDDVLQRIRERLFRF
jgi:hypothetical protein